MLINCHTYYSLKYGTISPSDLIKQAVNYGYDCIALTDINNTSTCLDFVRQAPRHGLRPVLGVDFRNGVEQKFIGLARNNEGYMELNRFLSTQLHEKADMPDDAPIFQHCYVIYPWHVNPRRQLRDGECFGVRPQDLQRLWMSRFDTRNMVVLQTTSFRNRKGFNAHRLLRAIDKNILLSKLEEVDQGLVTDRMLRRSELLEAFAAFPEIIDNTLRLLDKCSIHFGFGKSRVVQNQRTYTGSITGDKALIRKLIEEGLPYRYPNPDQVIRDRIEKELAIIEQKGFVAYFLINWDILKYARSKGYFYVGRGSGANSVVAYLLRITDVDPIDLDLYFERFINLYRANPPDFDIDFSWRDRDDVTAYIFNRFENVALMGTYNTFQYKAIVRELGKVFGLPKSELDVLSSGKFNYDNLDQLNRLVFKYANVLQGVPSHLSVHASGIVITEKPVHYFSATFMPPKGYPTTQFDMVIAEDAGLFKFDVLSQRGLGKIKDALAVVAYNQPGAPAIDIHDIKRFKEDERIKDMLRNAKAIGCFYVESPAMRMLLRKLQVDDYLGLVAASSVIRPGVAKSGMMREFILRFRYPNRRKDAHPVLYDLMPETYGVMVYQEDVIKVAHYFAGLDLGEADMLRRGMSGKFRSREEFAKVKEKYFINCRNMGRPDQLAREVWRQIESFAGYAFAKGHSASYAVESYQSLFLKAYYPLEYMVATINNFGGFYRSEVYVHEARLHGGIIHPPCVNRSDYQTTIQGKDIFLGFLMVHALEGKVGKWVELERKQNGVYQSFDDFLDRVPISAEQVSILIRIDAFRFTGRNKRELMWEVHFKLGKQPDSYKDLDLFKVEKKSYDLPALKHTQMEAVFDQMELLGFSLQSPFDVVDEALPSRLVAKDLIALEGKVVTVVGYLVTTKNTTTSDRKNMQFGTFLDLDGQFLDTVHFPPVVAKYPFKGRGVYKVTGKVVVEFDCESLEVMHMEKMPVMVDPRFADVTDTALTKVGVELRRPMPPMGRGRSGKALEDDDVLAVAG